jgi:hypothetical protein
MPFSTLKVISDGKSLGHLMGFAKRCNIQNRQGELDVYL